MTLPLALASKHSELNSKYDFMTILCSTLAWTPHNGFGALMSACEWHVRNNPYCHTPSP